MWSNPSIKLYIHNNNSHNVIYNNYQHFQFHPSTRFIVKLYLLSMFNIYLHIFGARNVFPYRNKP